MELLDLTYFVEAAHQGNFTKAAEQLFVTQPTLSRRIASFERELGTRLFVREPQSVSLTAAGRALLPRAQQILDLCATVPDIVHGLPAEQPKDEIAGLLRVGHQEFIDDSVMVQAITSLRGRLPQVHVEPSVDRINTLRKSLMAGRIDAAFFVINKLFDMGGLSFHKVMKGSMKLLVTQDSDYAKRGRVSIDELKDADLVMFDRNLAPVYYDFVSTQCINHGFLLSPVRTVENMSAVVLAVASGMGVGFIYSHSNLMSEVAQRGLCALDIDGADFSYDYGIAWREGNDGPALHEFVHEVDLIAEERAGASQTRDGQGHGHMDRGQAHQTAA